MDLRRLRYFCLVADRRSIAQASAHLGVAAPAISRSIAALEEEFDCVLFERDGRGMRLTAPGAVLFERAQQILRDVEIARRDVMAEAGRLGGEIAVGATPSVVALIGAWLIAQCRDRFPTLRPRLSEGYSAYLENWVATGLVDFALTNGADPSSPRIERERLAIERLYAISQPTIAEPIALREILDAPLLLPSARNPIRGLIDQAATTLGRSVATALEIDSAELLKDLAEQGFGVAILPYAAVQRDVEAGRLSARAIVEPEIRSDLTLIHLRDKPPSRAAIELIATILDGLEAIASGDAPHGFIEIRRPKRFRRPSANSELPKR